MPFIENVDNKKFRATAVEALLTQAKSGNPMVKVTFQLLEPPHLNLVWNGMLHNEKATERTLDALALCGWTGDDLASISFPNDNEVALVLENELYDGKQHTRIKFVNRRGGADFKLKDTLSDVERQALAAKLKGAVLAHKAKAPKQDADIPF